MAGPLTHVNYISDDANTYVVRMDASNATAVGATSAAAGSRPNIPHGYHPRVVLAQHPTTGRERRIPITDPASALWTGGTTQVTLPDFGTLAPVAFNIAGRVGEKRYAR